MSMIPIDKLKENLQLLSPHRRRRSVHKLDRKCLPGGMQEAGSMVLFGH